MNRLGLITSLGAMLALPACIVEHGLGETAEGSSSSDDSEHGTGSGTESPPDPSATSGQPPTATSTSATSGGTDEPPDPTTDTDGEPGCEQDPEHVRWEFNGAGTSPLSGIDAAFLAILMGDCLVADVHGASVENDATLELQLQCSLSGRIDDDAMASGDFTIELQLTGTALAIAGVVDVLEPIQQVHLSVVSEWWSMGWMGWNGWLVLEDAQGAPLLDIFDAEYWDPIDSWNWGDEVEALLNGESWHGGLHVGATRALCEGPFTECGDVPMAVTVGWIEESPLVLHPYQEATVGTPFPEQQMRVSLTEASEFISRTCPNMPQAQYALAAWAVTP